MSDLLDPVNAFFKIALAVKNDDSIAVKENNLSITYLEFLQKVQLIAGAITSHSKNEKIALVLPQGHKAYASMFASLAAGSYYCPINVDAPDNRINNILNEFIPDIIIYSEETSELIKNISPQATLINIDDALKRPPLLEPCQPHEIAYVIFTSGSTGTPKGVVIGRKGLTHYLGWSKIALKINETSIVSQHPNIGFDLSVLDIYSTLCNGGTLIPITGMKYRTMPALAIKEHKITHWISVPSIVDLIGKSKQLTSQNISSLTHVVFCGEQLFEHQLKKLFEASPSLNVINTYGPTEATVSCTELSLNHNSYKDYCYNNNVSIGTAIDGITLTTKKEDEAELIITGEQVALGYWQDDNKTTQSFSIKANEERRYFTGDIVQSTRENLYFAHRTDNQIKINGYRIELAEVDFALHQLGFNACITVFKNNQLYCFIENEKKLAPLEVTKMLASILPSYMLPKEVIILDNLPRNINDKIDAKQLKENYINE